MRESKLDIIYAEEIITFAFLIKVSLLPLYTKNFLLSFSVTLQGLSYEKV
jgi:hypothetical protein